MQRYVAFLRAINVGGHVVKMDVLRKHLEALKYKNVTTFIASGNVIFEAPGDATAIEANVEAKLRRALGYDVATFLRTPTELAAIGRHHAVVLPRNPGSSLYVIFMKHGLSRPLEEKLMAFAGSVDDFHVHERQVLWLVKGKLMESPFSAARFEKTIGGPVTVRNITTVRRLVAKYGT